MSEQDKVTSNPPTPTNINTVEAALKTLLDEFAELSHTLHYKNDDLKLLPGDVKIARQKMIAKAGNSILDTVSKRVIGEDEPFKAGDLQQSGRRQARNEARQALNAIRKELEEG